MSLPKALNIAGLAVALEHEAIADGQVLVFDASLVKLVAADLPACEVAISAGAETADVVRVTMQVVDFSGAAKAGRFVIAFDISDSLYGPPVSTQVVTIATGTEYREAVANQAYDVMTDSAGKIQIDVEVAGSGTRYFHARVLPVSVSAGVSWVGTATPAGWQFNAAANSGHALMNF